MGVYLVPGCTTPDELEATVVPLVIAIDDEEAHRYFLEARATAGRPPDRYIRHLDQTRHIHDEVVRRHRTGTGPAQDHGVPPVSFTTPPRHPRHTTDGEGGAARPTRRTSRATRPRGTRTQ